MKKYFKSLCVSVSFATGILATVIVASSNYDSLLDLNVEALTQGEMSADEIACRAEGGVWNHYSNCEDGGVIVVPCSYEGQITVLGITLKGAYEVGNTYPIYWARYSCEHEALYYCCTKQGIYIIQIRGK